MTGGSLVQIAQTLPPLSELLFALEVLRRRGVGNMSVEALHKDLERLSKKQRSARALRDEVNPEPSCAHGICLQRRLSNFAAVYKMRPGSALNHVKQAVKRSNP